MTSAPRGPGGGPKQRPATKKDIVAAIKKAGYPLEQRVAVALDTAGFAPIVSWVWRDERRGDARGPVDRELDLAASAEFSMDDPRAALRLHILIECKRFSDGMVVFEAAETDNPADASLSFDNHFWGQPRIFFASPERVGGPTPLGLFRWMSERWAPTAVEAYQYGVARRVKDAKHEWVIDHGDAHESVDGLARALHAYRGDFGQVVAGNPDPYLNFAALTVVVEGPIYAHRVRSSASVRSGTRLVDHASYYRRVLHPDGYRSAVRIDFVRERALPKYVESLAAAGRAMAAKGSAVAAALRDSVERSGNTRDAQE